MKRTTKRKPPPPPPPPPPAPATGIYWGAQVGGKVPTTENMAANGPYDAFETLAGKKTSIISFGIAWKQMGVYVPFPITIMNNVRNHGSIPFFDWMPLDGPGYNQPAFTLKAITSGLHDPYIYRWADAARTWGFPFFIRLMWEMNGTWQFPWSVQLNTNAPADYIPAWRHIHDIFTATGATNVSWVFCPNISGTTTTPVIQLYPGDDYVDWTSLDGYNKYLDSWLMFNQIFNGIGINWLGHSYDDLLAIAPTKPIIIGETGALEAGDGGAKKAAWIKDMYATIPMYFPRIKGVIYFSWNDGNPANTFPIDSSPLVTAAFKDAIGSSIYQTNIFANSTGTIQVP